MNIAFFRTLQICKCYISGFLARHPSHLTETPVTFVETSIYQIYIRVHCHIRLTTGQEYRINELMDRKWVPATDTVKNRSCTKELKSDISCHTSERSVHWLAIRQQSRKRKALTVLDKTGTASCCEMHCKNC